MKAATLTLYYKSLLNKDKNFILDDPNNGKSAVENYLSTLENNVITGFQYQKHQMVLTLKIDRNQTTLNMGQNAKDLNYIKIQNEGENPKYYFIIGKNWKAENTIELVCNMDTLNSFEFNRDYEINKKTLVKREHRDRFSRLASTKTLTFELDVQSSSSGVAIPFSKHFSSVYTQIEFDIVSYEVNQAKTTANVTRLLVFKNTFHQPGVMISGYTTIAGHIVIDVTISIHALEKIIDLKSEEINVPVYKENELTLYEKLGDSVVNWSLYYRNTNNQENAPVECLLCPDTAIDIGFINTSQDARELNSSNIPSGKYIIFCSTYPSGQLLFKIGNVNQSISNEGTNKFNLIAVQNDNGTIKVYSAQMQYVSGTPKGTWAQIYTGEIRCETDLKEILGHEVASLPNALIFMSNLYKPEYATYKIDMSSSSPDETILLSKVGIDRTLATNIKIIDVPYCPSSYEYLHGVYTMLPPWIYSVGLQALHLIDTSARFVNDIESNGSNVFNDFVLDISNITIDGTQKRFLKDTKLLHSDYYRPKFVYDSFSKIFALEQLDFSKAEQDDKLSASFNFRFVMSRNIVSKFLFKFTQLAYKNPMEDYDNILPVARNNEEVLYNSAYLNYIRTGYNYDLKAKERQEKASGIGIGLNALALIASGAIGAVTGNPIAIGSAMASGIGLVSQIVGYAKSTAQNEENIQRKLQETQNQSISVLNADDVDLLIEYSDNKAKLCYYKASNRMMDILDDLFYYGGYVCNEQKIPYVRSRYWFNFVQASLIMEETNNLTEEIEKDIKDKFENGVTFLHYRQNKFDFKQEMENIETKLV